MADIFEKNRRTLKIDEGDAALIFKEDGHVDLSFPDITEDDVPEHVLAALAISYAVMDEKLFNLIQDKFAEITSENLENGMQGQLFDIAETQELEESQTDKKSHLKIVS